MDRGAKEELAAAAQRPSTAARARRHPRPRVRGRVRRRGSCCSPTAPRSPTARRARCSPRDATSPPRRRGSSAARAARCARRRAIALITATAGGARMSWQLAAFGAPRARPRGRLRAGTSAAARTPGSSRSSATLAAFAALGRIAFAALPNVKPTTDIVLISGYALGGGPGFVVGAIAGLTSNFFFGQGPWTPWQMAAWGATGLIGAGLARVTRGRIARWPLAIVCVVVGLRVHRDPGRRRLGHLQRPQPRAARRVRRQGRRLRLHPRRRLPRVRARVRARADALDRPLCRAHSGGVANLRRRGRAGGSRSPAASAVLAGVPRACGAARAGVGGARSSYLLGAQNRDGGFGSSPGAASSQLYAGWVALGLAAAGHNPADVAHGGREPARVHPDRAATRTPARSSGRSSSRARPGRRRGASAATT